MDRGRTPWSSRYFTTVTRLPPVAFMGSAKNRSLPSRPARSKYERSRSSTYSMLRSSFVSSREILNRANGVTYPCEEYSWISLDMIMAGSRAPRSMTHITAFSMRSSTSGILCTAKFCTGQRHRGAHDEVVLLLAGRGPEGEIEQQLVGALRVVDELGMLGAHVAQLGDEPGHLAVHLARRGERVHVHAVLAGHDVLHRVSHLVEQRDEVRGGLVVPCGAGCVRQHAEKLQGPRERGVHALECALVVRLQVPVQVLRLQNHLCHGATLHPGPGSGQSKASGVRCPRWCAGALPFGEPSRVSGSDPAVYRLAVSLGLAGFVQNRRSEVVAEVQGDEGSVARFAASIAAAMPPAARIESMSEAAAVVRGGETGFRIVESGTESYAFPPIPPDLPLCADCARELLSRATGATSIPSSPAPSAGRATPSWSARRSTARTPPCARSASAPPARRNTPIPSDRRFHSQTNSCAECGPSLACFDGSGKKLPGDPVGTAVEALRKGRVVAVLGIGGYHLAADPRSRDAIRKAETRKGP